MNPFFRLLLSLLLVVAVTHTAQAQRLPLDNTIFKSEIRDYGWSMEDTAKKKMPEFLLLSFARDTLGIAYFNLLDGAAGSYSAYDCTYGNNFMEVKALSWQPMDDTAKVSAGMAPMQYLYTYRKSKTELAVLFSRTKKKMNDALLKETDWVVFTRMNM